MFDRSPLRHRGFELTIRRSPALDAFEFVVRHLGLDLHASSPDFRTVMSAERAARRFVDEALQVFDTSTTALAA